MWQKNTNMTTTWVQTARNNIYDWGMQLKITRKHRTAQYSSMIEAMKTWRHWTWRRRNDQAKYLGVANPIYVSHGKGERKAEKQFELLKNHPHQRLQELLDVEEENVKASTQLEEERTKIWHIRWYFYVFRKTFINFRKS